VVNLFIFCPYCIRIVSAMDRVRNFTDSELSPDEKGGIRLLVSKRVLDPALWTLENVSNEELLKVCKDALKVQQPAPVYYYLFGNNW